MTDILESIADLTHFRNRHELERAFAAFIFSLAEPLSLVIWRVERRAGEVKLRAYVTLPQPQPQPEPPGARDGGPRPEWTAWLETLETLETAVPVRSNMAESNTARHVYPIHDGSRVSGLLEIIRPAPFTRLEEHMLASLIKLYGNHAGLLDYGERDELTGLLNRRSFSALFNQLLSRGSGVIAVVDIDFFKRINDEFGHPYGDEVLILMARLMEQHLGGADGVFRFGGEEFVVLFGGDGLSAAWQVLDGFRATVEATCFPQLKRVTVSIGVSAFGTIDTGAAAFGRADEALYIAKERGRNQVQCFEWLVDDGSLASDKKFSQTVELF